VLFEFVPETDFEQDDDLNLTTSLRTSKLQESGVIDTRPVDLSASYEFFEPNQDERLNSDQNKKGEDFNYPKFNVVS
jgi:hypothetical protein